MKWGLVGASDIAATRMIAAMRAAGHEVVGVMSASEDRAQRYARAHGLARATLRLDELLAWDIDAVYVSTTNDLHAAQVRAAANARKHVLSEKPLAMTVSDARSMVQECRSRGVVLATNHHLRASSVLRAARDLLSAGELGELRAVRIHHAVSLPDRLRGWRMRDRSSAARWVSPRYSTTPTSSGLMVAVLSGR
jgi:1,5-anhydro-D-fructose reductase (1,5-anhydro-D-mannitol-forming)